MSGSFCVLKNTFFIYFALANISESHTWVCVEALQIDFPIQSSSYPCAAVNCFSVISHKNISRELICT